MIKESSIEIINGSDKEMGIIHEPEGFEFMLPPNEVIKIEFDAVENSLARCTGGVR